MNVFPTGILDFIHFNNRLSNMKKILCFLIVIMIIMVWSCKKTDESLQSQAELEYVKSSIGDVIPGQYVVLLKEGATPIKSAKLNYKDAQVLMHSEMLKILESSQISPKEALQVYTASIEGFAVKLSEQEANALAKNTSVLGVWPDRVFTLAKPGTNPTPLPKQTTPYGIDMVGGSKNYTGDNKIWIIDTGIDITHPDLNVDGESGVSYVPRTTPNDDNGHGTHCAGIAAAIDNSVGVVGVAAGAQVVPIKVLDKRGSGWMSNIIKGVDYVTANGKVGDAVNMSLGGGVYEPLDLEVEAMGASGLFVALAAGNESDDASNHSPARANGLNIYTVSACDDKKIWAYFSNYGNPPVDYCAPGVKVLSLYKGGSMATMSGTSMAAPHMCGVLLITGGHPRKNGSVTNDPDGEADFIVSR